VVTPDIAMAVNATTAGSPNPTPGRILYEGWYRLNDGQSSVNGMILPVWDDMPEEKRAKWEELAEIFDAETRKKIPQRTKGGA